MEMRDRLIDTKEYAKQMRKNAVKDENGIVRVSVELWEQIADIIERSIIPPCKVGDVVWFDTYKKSGTVSLGIQPHKVDRIDVICVVGEKELVETKLHDWYFGDSVFLTKDEAVKALKGREGNG